MEECVNCGLVHPILMLSMGIRAVVRLDVVQYFQEEEVANIPQLDL